VNHIRNLALVASIIVSGTSAAQAPPQTSPQPAPPADQLQKAAAHFAQQNWSATLDAYSALAKAYPSHALSRFRVGVALVELNRFAEGEASLREGERLGMPAGQAAYRLAQAAAQQGRSDEAIRELLRSASSRAFIPPSVVDTSRHLRTVRSHARWTEVLDAFDLFIHPCMHNARHREFDFWIGDWDVRPAGQPATGPAARNIVTADEDGCVITEHWRPGSGSQGRSFNLYDRSLGVWRQTWVDNVGGQHDYRGNLKDGNMVFMGEIATPGLPGRRTTRLTFFNISRDSVRQFNEFTLDSGKTWQVGYDLMYVRRAADTAAPPLVASPLSDADRKEIAAVGDAFVNGWLRNDSAAVLGLFMRSALLVPPRTAPVSGIDAIRAFWWPVNAGSLQITSYQRTVEGVTGNREMAVVTASVALTWTSTTDGKTTTQSSKSVELQTLGRDALGRWKIVRHAWR
jgi:uncharacterized protein (TIGR02246 family)